MRQSALECGCTEKDLLRSENTVALSAPVDGARCYLRLPHICNLVSYGAGVVATLQPGLEAPMREYMEKYSSAGGCFETPALHEFTRLLQPYGAAPCFMAEYFLPDIKKLRSRRCRYTVRRLAKEEFAGLYLPEWSNALCAKRKEYDIMAFGAYDGEKLIGLAGASADCEKMYQIGIDVLSEYRHQGVASALTSRLARQILKEGKVPFYCAAWSNLASVRNALRSGFVPAWVELTAKSTDFIQQMNEQKA